MNPRVSFLALSEAVQRSPLRLLRCAEAILAATVVGSVMLIFNAKVSADGFSYYGVQRRTLPVLFVGLFASIMLILKAAAQFAQQSSILLANFLRFFCIAVVGIFLTPYSVNALFEWTHKFIGVTLFVSQMVLALHLTFIKSRDGVSYVAIFIQLLGGLLALFSLPDNSLGYQFEGQVIFQMGFFILINHVVKQEERVSMETVSDTDPLA